MKREQLKQQIIGKIQDYLDGRATRQDTAAWAISKITSRVFTSDEVLLEDALAALAGLHDEEERFQTAREDLINLLSALKGLAPYSVTIISN